MAKPFKMHTKVQWKWLGGLICGVVQEVHLSPTAKLLKGKLIKRNGSPENPAYLVRSDAGNFALKLQSELSLPAKSARPDGGF